MSEHRDPHSAQPEDLDLDAEQAEDVKGGEGIVSPRDPASGLPTGKRNLNDIVITKPIDKGSPGLG